MALRTFHPCSFNFGSTNIRRVGNVIDGGTSLSGLNDLIEADGGGYIAADFTNGFTRDASDGKAWRAQTDAMDSGATPVVVLLCAEKNFQPVNGRPATSPHEWNKPIADDAPDKGAAYTASANAALRATTLAITGNSERPITGGELFSINHLTWGWRAYRIDPDGLKEDGTIGFRPPLREAVTAATPLEFDTPRCVMRLAQKTDNPTDNGTLTTCSISFVEHMRKPPA